MLKRPAKLKLVLALLILGASIIFVGYFAFSTAIIAKNNKPTWGASFTKSFAEYLELDWRKLYLEALDDLKIQHFRIGLNWDEVEIAPDKFDFSDFDWMLDEAEKRNAKIILAVGRKLPRWPECRAPEWTKELSSVDQKERILNYLEKSVDHFKNRRTLVAWQVENEPFFRFFGSGCPAPDTKFLKQEMALVKRLDPVRSIMITDSGELSLWWKSASLEPDILGISIYRRTWNKYFGFREYPFPPWAYNLKARLINWRVPRIIISELQAEPWAPQGFHKLTPELETKTITKEKFRENINFARQSGFDEIYLWGLEWWYYKKQNDDQFYWETIKQLQINRQ